MDFEDEDKPKYVSKTRRFAPGRARKSKPEPTPVHSSETDAPSESVSKKKTLMEEEEEEDVVVREIDVFYNPSIGANTELYVLQYPLRPSWRAYEMDERCQEVRVNPSTSEVELDLSMDVNSTNYDSKSASELHMTKQLHLNPVHAVPQLRPSMKYLSSKRIQAEAPEESARASKKQNKGVSKDQKPVPEEVKDKWGYFGLLIELLLAMDL
ncbi:BnaA02g30930D [Brassica napus]|uniref:BnaA02g30930D protein n=1 Tax=Brassica napus TaxID=3708 RepID=A0A078H8S2_BRANA|nr:BnaA02g30930D [Brassica napus]